MTNYLVTFDKTVFIADRLPYSIRVLLESAIRNCDNFQIKEKDVHNILNWEQNEHIEGGIEVPFKPARVILQVRNRSIIPTMVY